jgi:hypothetical protein
LVSQLNHPTLAISAPVKNFQPAAAAFSVRFGQGRTRCSKLIAFCPSDIKDLLHFIFSECGTYVLVAI